MDERARRGRDGEAAAERYLVRRGWTVLARNWRGGGGELDLVVRRAGVVAFCEVKTRGDPEALREPLGARQRARVARAAGAFLARRPELDRDEARLDVLTVRAGALRARVRHQPAAFTGPDGGA